MITFLDLYLKQNLLNSKFVILNIEKLKIMKEDKKWMLMTYYCPTHGDSGRVEPIQVTRGEISNKLYKKSKSKKDF